MIWKGYTATVLENSGLFENVKSQIYTLGETNLFLEVAKALLATRLFKKQKSLELRYGSDNYLYSTPVVDDAIGKIKHSLNDYRDQIHVFLVKSDLTSGYIDFLKDAFPDNYVQLTAPIIYNLVEDGLSADDYFKRYCGVFANKDTNMVAFVICKDNYEHMMNLLAIQIPFIYEELFEEFPLKAYEQGLLDTIVSAFREYDVRKKLEVVLANVTSEDLIKKRLNDMRIDIIKRGVATSEMNFQNLESKYNATLRTLKECQDELTTARNDLTVRKNQLKKENEDNYSNDFTDIFTSNEDLEIVSINNGQIVFDIASAVVNYDPDTFESCQMDDEESVLNKASDWDVEDLDYEFDDSNTANRRMVAREIFMNERARLRMATRVNVNFFDQRIWYGYPDDQFMNRHHCIPNYHLAEYGCTGGYIDMIQKAIGNYDAVMLLNLISACCGNLNFSDTTVMEKFIKGFFGDYSNQMCIDIDGEFYTPCGAIRYFKELGCYYYSDEDYNKSSYPTDIGYIDLNEYEEFAIDYDNWGNSYITYNNVRVIDNDYFREYEGRYEDDGTFIELYDGAQEVFNNLLTRGAYEENLVLGVRNGIKYKLEYDEEAEDKKMSVVSYDLATHDIEVVGEIYGDADDGFSIHLDPDFMNSKDFDDKLYNFRNAIPASLYNVSDGIKNFNFGMNYDDIKMLIQLVYHMNNLFDE